MTRASISLTPPNEAWIQQKIDSLEYASRSEVLNDLIRRARQAESELEFIRDKLIESEQLASAQGFVSKNAQEMLAGFKAKARQDGKL